MSNIGAAIIGAVGALIPAIVGASWFASNYVRDVDQKLADLESRLNEYELSSGNSGEGSQLVLRLVELEGQVSQLTSDTSQINSEIQSTNSSVIGSVTGLGDRISKLEQGLALVQSSEVNDGLGSVNTLQVSNLPKINTVLQDAREWPTQTFGDFELNLQRCSRRTASIDCYGIVKYSGPRKAVRVEDCVLTDRDDRVWPSEGWTLAGVDLPRSPALGNYSNLTVGEHQLVVRFRDVSPDNEYSLSCKMDRSFTFVFDNV